MVALQDEYERIDGVCRGRAAARSNRCGRAPCRATTRSGTSTRPDHNADLNKIINETLARNGKLTESDLDQIYDTYLSQGRTTDRIDKIGARVISEIDDVMSLITDALGMSAELRRQPERREPEAVARRRSRPGQRVVVERLVASTREMQETNRRWKSRLNNSKLEINNLQQNLEAIRAESLTDPLTGLGNRKYFDRVDRRGGAPRASATASRCRC